MIPTFSPQVALYVTKKHKQKIVSNISFPCFFHLICKGRIRTSHLQYRAYFSYACRNYASHHRGTTVYSAAEMNGKIHSLLFLKKESIQTTINDKALSITDKSNLLNILNQKIFLDNFPANILKVVYNEQKKQTLMDKY